MKQLLLRIALFASALFGMLTLAPSASAYAWMVRHDYIACGQCHADPSGGGLLTEYGRAQGEVLLRTRYGKNAENEEPGKVADFAFGAIPLPKSLALGGDVRGLLLHARPQGAAALTRFILMQADVQAQVTVDRFRANGSVGFASEGANGATIARFSSDAEAKFLSRTHWAGVDVGADHNILIRAGRMNLPFGLRSIEHTLWVRSSTRTNINDAQQYGVAAAYTGDKLRGEVMAILGNFALHPSDYRDYGGVGFAEYTLTERLALGASALVVHSSRDVAAMTPMWRHAYGVFGRYSPTKMLVLSTEVDLLYQSQPPTATAAALGTTGLASMLQADVEPIQGVHLLGTGELAVQNVGTTGASYGGWGSVAWFFLPHTDVRLDAVYRSTADSLGRSNALTLLAQLHLFL